MSNFDFGTAWSSAMDYLRANYQMLLIVVGAALLVSELVQLFLGGDSTGITMNAMTSALKDGDFSDLAAVSRASGGGVGAGLAGIIAGLLQGGAGFAAYRLGLAHDGNETLGSAFLYGLGAAVLTALLVVAVAVVAGIVIAVPMVALGLSGGSGGMGSFAGALIVILALALMVLLFWLIARLAVVAPAMAQARSMNPLYGLSESWRLTRGHALLILIYLILTGIALGIVGIIGIGIMTVIGAMLGPLAVTLLVLIVTIPLAMVGNAITAGIYRTLAPRDMGEVFA